MNHSSNAIAIIEEVPNNLQFMQDIRRHNRSIHARKFYGANRYDLTSLAIAFTTSALRELVFSLAAIGRLFSRVDMNDFSHKKEQLEMGKIDDLLIIVSQRDGYDEEFSTTVASLDEVRHFGRDENLNFIPCSIVDLLKAKIRAEW